MLTQDRHEQLASALAAVTLPSGIAIRPWNEGDFPVIQRLSDNEGWPTPSARPTEALWSWQWSWPALVATADTEVVGFVRGLTDGAVTTYIAELLVAPVWRGTGIGAALVETCHALYPSARLDLLSTAQAERFYTKTGFRSFTGFRKSYR